MHALGECGTVAQNMFFVTSYRVMKMHENVYIVASGTCKSKRYVIAEQFTDLVADVIFIDSRKLTDVPG